MNYPKMNYKKQGKTVAVAPILKSLKEYLPDWIKISKEGYVEGLMVDSLCIPGLYKTLKECIRIYNGNKNKKPKLIEIGQMLRPDGTYSNSGYGLLISFAQRTAQLPLFAKNIREVFEKNGYKLEDWPLIYKSIKESDSTKKIPDDIVEILKQLIFIQNEVFKVAHRKPLNNQLDKEFADNLQEFVEVASEFAGIINSTAPLMDLIEDVGKLSSGKINTHNRDKILNDISEDAVEMSEEVALLKNKLIEPNSKSLPSKLKSFFKKKKSSIKNMKSSKGKINLLKETIKENKQKLTKINKEIKKLRAAKKRKSMKKIEDSNEVNNLPTTKQLDSIQKSVNDLIEKQKKLNKEYEEKIQN